MAEELVGGGDGVLTDVLLFDCVKVFAGDHGVFDRLVSIAGPDDVACEEA